MITEELNREFPEVEQYSLKHAIRLNGVVDVWRNGKTIFSIPDKEYRNLELYEDRIKYIRECLNKHKKKVAELIRRTLKGQLEGAIHW